MKALVCIVIDKNQDKIRKNEAWKQLHEEIELFIPVLRETYRQIEEFQFHRSEENEIKLRLQIMRTVHYMQLFKPHIQRKWLDIFAIVENQQCFPISDVICALDMVIHRIHLRTHNRGLLRVGGETELLSPWSSSVKDFLDERRKNTALKM